MDQDPAWIRIWLDSKILDPVHPYELTGSIIFHSLTRDTMCAGFRGHVGEGFVKIWCSSKSFSDC